MTNCFGYDTCPSEFVHHPTVASPPPSSVSAQCCFYPGSSHCSVHSRLTALVKSREMLPLSDGCEWKIRSNLLCWTAAEKQKTTNECILYSLPRCECLTLLAWLLVVIRKLLFLINFKLLSKSHHCHFQYRINYNVLLSALHCSPRQLRGWLGITDVSPRNNTAGNGEFHRLQLS